MPRVLVSGYFGFGNVGDEALLAAMVGAWRARLPDLQVTVTSAAPTHTASQHDVTAVGRTDLPAIIRALAKADLLVSGGGSLLQDATGPWTIPYYLGIVSLALLRGCPVFLYAQGIGPVGGRLGRFLIRLLVNRADCVTVRDSDSAAELRRLGVLRPPLEVTADAVFTLKPTGTARGRAFLLQEAPAAAGSPVIGVSLRDWQPGVPPEAMAAALDGLAAETGALLLFIPMHYPADHELSRAVAAKVYHPAVVMSRRLATQDLLDMCSALDMMVGMRLHSLIFAALGGVIPVGISYDPKIDAFLSALGLEAATSVKGFSPQEFLARALPAWWQRDKLALRLAVPVAELRQKAEHNADLLVSLLTGGGEDENVAK